MSARAISEASGKRILNSTLESNCGAAVCRFATVTPDTDWDKLAAEHGWLNSEVRPGDDDQHGSYDDDQGSDDDD